MPAGYLRTMPTRFLPVLLSLLFFLCGIPAQAVTAYRPPDLEKEIFNTKKIKLEKFDRTDAVGGLVAVARDFDDEDKVDFELRAHALAIAHRLDKDNDRIKSVLSQLKDKGKTIDEPATKARIVGRLMRGLRGLGKAKDNEDNNKCAAYIVDIALRLDPDGDSVKKLEEQQKTLSEAGFKADWKDMLGKAIRHSRNPWDEEEEVFEKKEVTMPGGTAEKFAQAQSRINGLVVRQLSGGNLAGSASTVNATALKEPGQKDLLFTFNQDVGPMMGGCLEEVIKFLRVRYSDKEDKIPNGFRIELGFQDKYVPKDGPSAATLFTLLLDSLFTGEALDEGFACTGDITADGQVQKIGGAPAKIRGATKRGCKIVGIPVDNAKEVTDVLLLDGIQQFLDIQVFTMKDFDQAHAISRLKKSSEVEATLKAFDEVVKVIKEKKEGGVELLKNAEVQKRLQGVLDQMPNHLSAKLLLEHGKGESPKTLSISGTLSQIEIASSGVLRKLGRLMYVDEEDEDEEVEIDKDDQKEAKEAVDSLKELSKQIDPRIEAYHKSVIKICDLMADGPDEDEDAKDFSKKIRESLESMQSTYRKMMENPEIMEED
jgi:Lon protease (S16) C-terminal proteolytic domain